MRRTAMLLVLLVTSLLALSPPAGAHAPRQSVNTFDVKTTIKCKDFTLREDTVYTAHSQRFVNSNGKLKRLTIHYRWQGTITNPKTGEFIAEDPGSWQTTYQGKTSTVRGRFFDIRIRSLGIRIHGVGKLVTKIRNGDVVFQSSTSKHHEDYDQLCRALAPILGD